MPGANESAPAAKVRKASTAATRSASWRAPKPYVRANVIAGPIGPVHSASRGRSVPSPRVSWSARHASVGRFQAAVTSRWWGSTIGMMPFASVRS
jgi:hypothetical protein